MWPVECKLDRLFLLIVTVASVSCSYPRTLEREVGGNLAAAPESPRGRLGRADVEEREPILQRLQRESAKNQPDAECAESPLLKIVGVVLDIRIDGYADASDKPSHHTHAQREQPRVIEVTHQEAAHQGGGNVSDRANYRSPKLATSKARAARGIIVKGWAHAARIGEDLAHRN